MQIANIANVIPVEKLLIMMMAGFTFVSAVLNAIILLVLLTQRR